MDKRPTIVDVAKKAGVSKSTVSLVVRNSSSVRDKTRLAVLHAMEELGYVYNRSAANMRTGNAGLVGLVINDLTNPFFTEFATSLQMALNEKGYATVVANTDDNPEIQDRVVGAMLEHGVSALILSPAYGDIDGTLATNAQVFPRFMFSENCPQSRVFSHLLPLITCQVDAWPWSILLAEGLNTLHLSADLKILVSQTNG